MDKVEVKRWQVINTKNWGRCIYQGLDFYMGQCSAKLKPIDYDGYRYPLIDQFEGMGFKVIES